MLATSGLGNELANTLTGNNADNELDGFQGIDTLIGGLGDDIYYVDGNLNEDFEDIVIENAGEGYDTIIGDVGSAQLPVNVEAFVLNFPSNLSASSWNRVFTGNELDNLIDVRSTLFDGYDEIWVDGGAGADIMIGSNGQQTYTVDDPGDVVIEYTGGDNDQVYSSVDFTLPSLVTTLLLSGSAPIRGVGNTLANTLNGSENSAANVLEGGWGDDLYILGAGDSIIEHAGQGIDTVRCTFTFTLSEHIENLTLTGVADSGGFGNDRDNQLNGWGGVGSALENWGANTLYGGLGNDTYILGEGDLAVEYADQGTDKVVAHVNYTLDDNIEDAVAADAVVVTGNSRNNVLGAEGYGSRIYGRAGNDILIAGGGASELRGGTGADTYRFTRYAGATTIRDISDDEIPDGAVDVVEFDATVALTEVQFGKSVDRRDLLMWIQGSTEQTTIAGFFDPLSPHNRIELFRFADGSTLTAEQIAAAFVINGTAGDDVLTASGSGSDVFGFAGADLLNGGSSNDLLDGGAGADTMSGGGGHDFYRVDETGDVIIENVNAGTDTVESSITYVLGDNVENLTLVGNADLNGTGNAGINTLRGNSGNNVLDGGGSYDTLYGGAGDDTYTIDELDTANENPAEGIDTVYASVSFNLAANLENAVLLGADDIYVGGNGERNLLTGNTGANQIDGKEGADTMIGGRGDDQYYVDEAGDIVIEAETEGGDFVEAGISYTLPDNVEGLTLSSYFGNASNGTGNALDNFIYGNSLNNVIDGGLGADVMEGDAGDDIYVVDNAGDQIFEDVGLGADTVRSSISWTLGADFEHLTLTGSANINGTGNNLTNVLTGNSANNTLSGGSGNDTLDGGGGTDSLNGGLGNDTYLVDGSDTITESSGEGTDTVHSSVTWILGSNIENLVLLGSASISGTGNSSANVLTGNSGNNTLNGGSGSDTMNGGLGDDTYVVAQTGDVVTEAVGEGIDLVQSSITYTLGNNVENLALTGTSAISGTGNTLDNILTGNSANNTLTGGAGNDTLDGGAGSDTLRGGVGDDAYIVGQTGDVVTENASEGTDTVRSAITYTLGSNLENLLLTGATAINGAGNTLSNVLTGNSANNTLTGGAGNDTLSGGDGADIYSYSSSHGADTINNSSADAAADRLNVTNLTFSQVTFSRSGDDLLMARNESPSDSVRVTNWFTVTGNQLDFVQFTDQTLTSAQINALFGGGAQFAAATDVAASSDHDTGEMSSGDADAAAASIELLFPRRSSGIINRHGCGLRNLVRVAADELSTPDSQIQDDSRSVTQLATAGFERAVYSHLTGWARMNTLLTEHLLDSDLAVTSGDLGFRYYRSEPLLSVSAAPFAGLLGSSAGAHAWQSHHAIRDSSIRPE